MLAAAGAVAVPPTRAAVLAPVGRFLAADDPIQRADIIVVALDADGAGVLEASDLVRSGVANRIAVFTDPPDPIIDREFLRRGLPYEDEAARSVRQLQSLGIGHVERIPRSVAGTEDEGKVLPGWCDEHGFRAIVVVAMADHCRRLRRVMRRAMRDHSTRVLVHGSRYSPFDPDRWWSTRGGLRTGIIEFEKLMLDFARHPLS